MTITGKGKGLPEELDISGGTLKGKEDLSAIEEENKESKEYIKNVTDQKTVKLSDAGKTDVEEETTIDFLKEDQVNSFTQAKTKISENKSAKMFGDKTTEQIQDEIKKQEGSQEKIDPETFVDVASFIISLVDSAMSTALRWWGKDNTSSPYELPKPKQEKLTKQLATILIKYQAKFPIEWLFLLGLLIAYLPGYMMAKDRRKAATPKQPIPVKPNPVIKPSIMKQPEVVNEIKNPVVENKAEEIIDMTEQIKPIEINETIDEAQLEVIKPTRGRGRPKKG